MQILGPRLLATKYIKPDKVGSLHIAPAWRQDNSRSLWEVKQSSPEADKFFGMALEPEWILITSPNSGVFHEYEWTDDDERIEIFFLAASSVLRVVPWTTGAIPKLRADRVLVRLVQPEERSETGIWMVQEGIRSTLGEIVEVGADCVEGLTPGDIVLFSEHAGISYELHGKRMMVLHEESVQAILPNHKAEEVA